MNIRIMGLMFLSGLLMVVQYQYQRIQALSIESRGLSQSNQFLQDQLQQADEQFGLLSTALQEHQQQQLKLEEKHENTRRNLRQALAQHPCAAVPVPESVIRLQRNALNNTGDEAYTDNPGTFTDTAPGTEL